jgi:cell wall-associated NlpC family hydrolase
MATSQGQAIVNASAAEAGTPYCFDGGNTSGPTHGSGGSGCGGSTVGFDCSGLALYAVFQATGIALPHGTGMQSAPGGTVISNQSDLQPGDLVFFGGGSLANFEHVGVYAGGGEMWDANDFNVPVQEHTLAWEEHALAFDGGVRYWSSVSGGIPWHGIGYGSTFLGTDMLAAGQELDSNQYIESADGRFALILQTDGNLVLYGGQAIWSITGGAGVNRLVVQTDGNLVLYKTNTPVWWTGGNGSPAHLILQSDGNLVTYNNSSGGAIWWSGTGGHTVTTAFGSDTLAAGQQLNASQQQYLLSSDKRYGLLLQSDGTLVLYGPGYNVLWSHHENGATRLVVQTDGNLVLYDGNTALWSSLTGGTGSAHITMQTDGNLVVYNDATGAVEWDTGTNGQI